MKRALVIAALLLVAACARGYGVDPLLIPPDAEIEPEQAGQSPTQSP